MPHVGDYARASDATAAQGTTIPSTTWDNLPREKQERIFLAAAEEFGAHGFSSGSLNVIARNAATAKGSLFQYFDDKMDLFRHVYVVLAAGTRAELEARLLGHLDAHTNLFAILRHLLQDFIEFHRAHPLEGNILRAMTFESDGEVRVMLREVVDSHYVELIGTVVELAEGDGQLRAGVSTDTLAASIHTMFMHLGVAGITPEMNPFVPLHELHGDELARAIADFTAPLEAYYGRPTDTD